MAKQVIDLEDDVTLPDVPVKIGGKERKLCFDMAAIVRVEKLTGINLFREVLEIPDAYATSVLLYAALLHYEPDLKLEEVQSWVTVRKHADIVKAVREAWIESTANPGDVPVGEAEAQAQP